MLSKIHKYRIVQLDTNVFRVDKHINIIFGLGYWDTFIGEDDERLIFPLREDADYWIANRKDIEIFQEQQVKQIYKSQLLALYR